MNLAVQQHIAWHPKCILSRSDLRNQMEMAKPQMNVLVTIMWHANTCVEVHCPV